MIWQFIKRDAAWPFAPAAALLFGYLRLPAARSGALALVGILPFAMVLGTAVPGLLVNGTRFEGALPIEGRRLWLSRVVSLLAVLWLSVLAGLTVTFFTSGDLVPPLEAGAGFTVVILAVKCVRIRELTGPRWLKLTVFFAGAGAIFAASSIDASRLPRTRNHTCGLRTRRARSISVWVDGCSKIVSARAAGGRTTRQPDPCSGGLQADLVKVRVVAGDPICLRRESVAPVVPAVHPSSHRICLHIRRVHAAVCAHGL